LNASLASELAARAARGPAGDIGPVLAKSIRLERLSMEEAAVLLGAREEKDRAAVFAAAAAVKDRIYGRRVVLFAPLYAANICANDCLYCSFRAGNKALERRRLTAGEIASQTRVLLAQGHKRVLLVVGEEDAPDNAAYYEECIGAVYGAAVGLHRIRRVNINCAPLDDAGFRRLNAAGIGTYQLFQETYDEQVYRRMHPRGPKADYENRLDAVDRAVRAGIDDFGAGVLLGLADWRFEALALLSHIEYLERTFGFGPHTISVPRIEPAPGAPWSDHPENAVSDDDFRLFVAVMRLAVPYTGIILSTREAPELRDALLDLGVSQMSAGSRTAPGGYCAGDNNTDPGIQFSIGDHRPLEEIVARLMERGYIPSFCAACYRRERTGAAFMELARPGDIRQACDINALVTAAEFARDFAGPGLRSAADRFIAERRGSLSADQIARLDVLLAGVEAGQRDVFV
jgi:2-iminoacetate synthase